MEVRPIPEHDSRPPEYHEEFWAQLSERPDVKQLFEATGHDWQRLPPKERAICIEADRHACAVVDIAAGDVVSLKDWQGLGTDYWFDSFERLAHLLRRSGWKIKDQEPERIEQLRHDLADRLECVSNKRLYAAIHRCGKSRELADLLRRYEDVETFLCVTIPDFDGFYSMIYQEVLSELNFSAASGGQPHPIGIAPPVTHPDLGVDVGRHDFDWDTHIDVRTATGIRLLSPATRGTEAR